MSYRLIKILTGVVAVSSLCGCSVLERYGIGTQRKEPVAAVPQAATTQQQISDDQIRLSEKVLSGEWNIYKVDGKEIRTEEDHPYINFSITDNRFYAFNGCNILNGDFTVKSGQLIEFSNMLATQKACQDSGYEYAINQAMGKVRSYSLAKRGQEFHLNLHDKDHLTVLTLRKHNLDFLNGAWRVSHINGEVCRIQDMQLLIDIPERRLHGNTGCNVLNGELSEDPDKVSSIQFQNIVTTRAACPDQAVETALLIALEEVETARRGHDKTAVLIDKNGRTLLVLTPVLRR